MRVTLGRVPVSQFQHLASLTYGSFEEPRFSGDFSEINIAHRWSRIVTVTRPNDWQATQTVIDLSQTPAIVAPDKLFGGRGVFFVTVEPVERIEKPDAEDIYSRIESASEPGDEDEGRWYENEDSQPKDGWRRSEGTVSKRFVMATDLGLLVKTAADGSRDVFVMALGAGQPVADVLIQALARNGSILKEVKTDATGRARLPAFADLTGERLPVAVMASKNGDTSFLPFNERQLPAMDYSRFDTEGVLASRIKAIEAFVFTERGVYRPGDTVHAGFITRRRDWQPVLEGLPLSISFRDSRGG